jgi:type IV pilus assembly protein PilO
VPMKVNVSGRYHQIAKFFYQVGQLDRIINMENISLQESAKAKAGGDIVLNVTALATAFHLVEGGAGAATDKKGKGRRKR